MKKIIAILLISAFCLFAIPCSAFSNERADKLSSLGLFRGTGSGYALNETGTRIQGLIMLLRLMGEENAALASNFYSPFTDVTDNTYKKYVAYAYHKGYTQGTSATTFSPNEKISFLNYIAFLLRALGYNEKKDGYAYENTIYKAAELGMLHMDSAIYLTNNSPTFYRGDMVDLSVSALLTPIKNQNITLAQSLMKKNVFTATQATQAGLFNGTRYTYSYATTVNDFTMNKTSQTYYFPSGKITADVIQVNLQSPKIDLKVSLAQNTIGASNTFSEIVSLSGADVVINANFFESYAPVWYPVGHIMKDGEFVFGSTGRYAFGFTENGEIRVGKPAIFFYVTDENGRVWACYEVNTGNQSHDNSILYNHYAGNSIKITNPGTVTVVENNIITNVYYVNSGETVNIPWNGFVMYFGNGFTSTPYYQIPQLQKKVWLEPRLFIPDDEGFNLAGITNLVSGGPRLVKQGAIYDKVDPEYSEARFTTSSTSRTAIGRTADGMLVIVSTPSATIRQLSELMHYLGCIDAINLDGGGSTALAYKGAIIRSPGRNLTSTLHIFEN